MQKRVTASGRLLGGAAGVAMMAILGSSCGTTSTPSDAQPSHPGASGDAASASETTKNSVNLVATVLKTDAGSPTAPSEGPGVDAGIVPTTKRSAAGLPEPLPDYLSWSLRQPRPPAAMEGALPHLAHRVAYAFAPKGKALEPQAPVGTVLLLEEKAVGKDFIGQLSVLTRAEEGWKASLFTRSGSADAFSTADAGRCSSCHKADAP